MVGFIDRKTGKGKEGGGAHGVVSLGVLTDTAVDYLDIGPFCAARRNRLPWYTATCILSPNNIPQVVGEKKFMPTTHFSVMWVLFTRFIISNYQHRVLELRSNVRTRSTSP